MGHMVVTLTSLGPTWSQLVTCGSAWLHLASLDSGWLHVYMRLCRDYLRRDDKCAECMQSTHREPRLVHTGSFRKDYEAETMHAHE